MISLDYISSVSSWK